MNSSIFGLLETVIAFAAIMLLLAYMVKSLTSLVKNLVDYYSGNLRAEVERLIRGTVGGNWENWYAKIPWLEGVRWDRLGEEFLAKENMARLLVLLDAPVEALVGLEDRIKIHLQNIKYAFETRTKNLSLALGLVLCLSLNINAFSIWTTLYNDQVIRGKLADPDKIEDLLAKIDKTEPAKTGIEAAKKERERLKAELTALKGDLSFGMGKIWSADFPAQDEKKPWRPWLQVLYELLGSLLTGILASIGAPYWHDLLRMLANVRQELGGKKPSTKAT